MAMRVLLTGATGFIGSALLPHLLREGHEVRAFARTPAAVTAGIPVVGGDMVTGAGLAEALDGVDVAYYLVHSMEAVDAEPDAFADRDRRAATAFADAARTAGVPRVIYLGGLVPQDAGASLHLASRLEVEELLLQSAPSAIAFRASIVVGARSRSFRFLVRLVERLPFVPLPPWRTFRTQPIDVRDVMAYLVAAATAPAFAPGGEAAGASSLDIAGPDVLSYGEIVERIADHLLVGRRALRLPISVTPVASRVAAAIAGEDAALIGPLMGGLGTDLLPRDDRVARLIPIRRHSFDAAVERALREWESTEELRAR
jgi:uncharacterized protein YbjT (DUF2867 family)